MCYFLFAFLQFRVTDTGVVDYLQTLYQHLLGHIDIVEGDGAVGIVAIVHLTVDEGVHQVTDALFGVFLQRAGGCLHGIGHHEDSLFTGEGVRSCIREDGLVDFLLRVLVPIRNIEILGLT